MSRPAHIRFGGRRLVEPAFYHGRVDVMMATFIREKVFFFSFRVLA
jgi:hypothetical protein